MNGLLLTWTLALAAGCSSEHLTLPSFSPDWSAKQALAEYDQNGDGYLDAKELERCPALKKSLEYMDTDGDGRLSAHEIADRIRMYRDSKVALTSATCRVLLDRNPLPGAEVIYVPEKFMGSSIKPASGVSDRNGEVELRAEGETLPGAQPGFYRVQVSMKNTRGEETLPARYNKDTVLGQEVSPRRNINLKTGKREDDDAIFHLTSKSK